MEVAQLKSLAGMLLVGVGAAVLVSGCETMTTSFGKKIDYKSASTAPALELPPDLSAPQYDERYNVAPRPRRPRPDAARPRPPTRSRQSPRPTRASSAKATTAGWWSRPPEQAWNTIYKFWIDTGFAIAVDQPPIRVIETDWSKPRRPASRPHPRHAGS
jgi:outer membrane protein assembly factor BamC